MARIEPIDREHARGNAAELLDELALAWAATVGAAGCGRCAQAV